MSLNPAITFEKTVRDAIMLAMNNGVPPTMIYGTLKWVAEDMRQVVINTGKAQQQADGILTNSQKG